MFILCQFYSYSPHTTFKLAPARSSCSISVDIKANKDNLFFSEWNKFIFTAVFSCMYMCHSSTVLFTYYSVLASEATKKQDINLSELILDSAHLVFQ